MLFFIQVCLSSFDEIAYVVDFVQRLVCWFADCDTLIKDGSFSLPGKKVLLEDDNIEVVLVDVTECPVERPQKNKENGILAKRNGTR